MDAVEVDGLRIAYRREGSGDPLLLLHGAYEDSRLWMDDMRTLAEHVDVIAWDAPGCGASDDVPEGWRERDWSQAAASFIRALGLERPAVAGLSFGSLIALLLGRDHPDAVGELVLVGAYAGWGGSLDQETVARRVAQAQRMTERPVAEWAEEFLGTVYSPGADRARRNLARQLLDYWRPETTAALLKLMTLDLRPSLPSIAVPTVVVRGARDERSPREASVAIVEAMPDAQLIEIADAGHDCAGPELDRLLVQAAHDAAARA